MLDGEKIRNLRTAVGMTMKDLGDKAGVTEMMISYIERGLRAPSAASLKLIADALDVKVDDLCKSELLRGAGEAARRGRAGGVGG